MADYSNTEDVLKGLFDKINQHIETRLEYFSLVSTEKLSILVSQAVGAMVIFVFSVLVLFFFSMSFAWWLGSYFNNPALGFALAGLLFIPIGAIIYWLIRPFVRDKIIQVVLESKTHPTKENNH